METLYLVAGLLILVILGVIYYYTTTISSLNNSAIAASASAVAAQQQALSAQKIALDAEYNANMLKAIADQKQTDEIARQKALAAQQTASDAAHAANVASIIATNKQQCAADTSKSLAEAAAKCASDTAIAVYNARAEQLAIDQQNAAKLAQTAIDAAVAAQQQIAAADKANAVAQAIKDTENTALLVQQQALATQAAEYAGKLQAAVSAAITAQKITDYAIISSRPSKFLMQNVGANNMCLTFPANGGQPTYAACDMTGSTSGQVFMYDLPTNSFKNMSGNCIDDGGVTNTGNAQFKTGGCYQMPNLNKNQTFQVYPDSGNIRSTYKNMCLDSNYGKTLWYWGCDANNNNQKWNMLPLV